MQATLARIESLHRALVRELFTINHRWTYAQLTRALDLLGRMVDAYDGPNADWIYLGDCDWATVPDLITGGYWHFAEWHSGQSSDSYKALCALGMVYKPGYESAPARDCSEFDVYRALDRLARKDAKMPVYSFVSISL